mgnify:CR=1 FL=1
MGHIEMGYIKTLYKFHKKEINTNIYIVFIGLIFIVLPLICLGNITEPISVIFVGIGCSIFATGLTVLLSLLYNDSNNRFYEYIKTIGLSDIFFAEDIKEILPKKIKQAQKIIYFSTDGCPLYLFMDNISIWKQVIKNHVQIRVLLGISTSSAYFDRHSGNAYEELLHLLLELGVECKEVDFSVNQILILDDVVWDIHRGVKEYPTRIMEYRNNNKYSNFYDYQYRIFCDNWKVGKYVNQ